MDKLREWARELRDNYDNSYWWVDHPELRAAMIGVISGVIALGFVYLECVIKRSMLLDGPSA